MSRQIIRLFRKLPSWPTDWRKVPVRLGKAKNALDVDDSEGIRLLSDIRHILVSNDVPRIAPVDLVSKLKSLDESAWDELTTIKLARLLRPFNITSRQLWQEDGNVRGYKGNEFKPVFESYLPPESR
jgi:hypothetical protein